MAPKSRKFRRLFFFASKALKTALAKAENSPRQADPTGAVTEIFERAGTQ
jgi:hypothetical protein